MGMIDSKLKEQGRTVGRLGANGDYFGAAQKNAPVQTSVIPASPTVSSVEKPGGGDLGSVFTNASNAYKNNRAYGKSHGAGYYENSGQNPGGMN